mmetsp:Transcript_94422/g.224920  ORF Transcript_94422/g.224920 Transcript_94422/m.224920 type:complete len:285 (-) Transcript_94422:3745-4599(-)
MNVLKTHVWVVDALLITLLHLFRDFVQLRFEAVQDLQHLLFLVNSLENMAVVLNELRLQSRGKYCHCGHLHVLQGPRRALTLAPAEGCKLRIPVVITHSADVTMPSCHCPNVGHEDLLKKLGAGGVGVQGAGIVRPRVLSHQLVQQAPQLGSGDLVLLVAEAQAAVAVELPELLEELPLCIEQELAVRIVRSFLYLRRQLIPLLFSEECLVLFCQGQQILGHGVAEVFELHKGRGPVQDVPGADERVHSLQIDENCPKGKHRKQPSERMVRRECLAGRSGQHIA